ncbi:MAG TPA: RNA polymerase sigma factor [Chthoniobacterales bacterium]|jgi:RNA polymerase sigma-70 factor (ECF subfamily)
MEKTHDDEDWKTCFAQLGPALLLFARRWTNCRADAEDIVQEAFVRFWRREHSISNRALLYAAVRSAALDRLRSEQRRHRREAAAAQDGAEQVEPQFTGLDGGQQMLAAAVERLPNEQREVVLLKIWNELTFAEIAAVLEISQNTAASRYRYALGALRRILQPHHE